MLSLKNSDMIASIPEMKRQKTREDSVNFSFNIVNRRTFISAKVISPSQQLRHFKKITNWNICDYCDSQCFRFGKKNRKFGKALLRKMFRLSEEFEKKFTFSFVLSNLIFFSPPQTQTTVHWSKCVAVEVRMRHDASQYFVFSRFFCTFSLRN